MHSQRTNNKNADINKVACKVASAGLQDFAVELIEQGADIKSDKSQADTVAMHTDEFATSLYLTFYAYSIADGKILPRC